MVPPGGSAIADPQTFIPIGYYSTMAFSACKLLYTPLILLDSSWRNMTPGLATSWTLSDDGKHWTMKLRKGVKFHDGTAFTARDVDFTYKLMIRREAYPALIDIAILEGATDYQMKKTETLAGLTVIDDYTVRFNLTSPSGTFLLNVSDIGILPAHAFPSDVLAKNVNDESIEKIAFFKTKPFGTGPFKLKDFDFNTHITLQSHKQYWKGAPLLDGIIFRLNVTGPALVSSLSAGQVDSAYLPDELTAHTLIHTPNLTLHSGPGLADEVILAVATEKPYMNVKVRQALRTAIDMQTLNKTIQYGLAKPAPSLMMYPALFPNPQLPRYDYDPVRARQLLKEGNWDPARTLVYGVFTSAGASPDYASAAIQNMWAAVGVHSKFKPLDAANQSTITHTTHHTYDVASLPYAWLAYDPSSTMNEYLSTLPISSNFTNYHNPRWDALMRKAGRMPTLQQAKSLYQQAQVILETDLPSIPLWIEDEVWAVNKRVHGGILPVGPLNDVGAEQWWVE